MELFAEWRSARCTVSARRKAGRQGQRWYAEGIQDGRSRPDQAESGYPGGVVFASFDHDVESFEAYLGPTILAYFDRLFNGRKLTILGYNRQRIPGNWKLMQENIKDPYHPGLLHTWFVTYGLWRADNKSALRMDDHFRHAAMISTRGTGGNKAEVTQGVSSFKENMEVLDKRLIDIVPEDWWNGPTAVMLTIFPSVIFQQQVNSVSTVIYSPMVMAHLILSGRILASKTIRRK